MVRVLIAGIVGGVLVFCGGAFTHMALGLEGRAFSRLAKEEEVRAFFAKQELAPGIYGFPMMKEGYEKLSSVEQAKEWERVSVEYKKGPAAYIIVPPNGEEMMSGKQLGSEFATNVLAALIAAWILACLAPDKTFCWRFGIVLSLGLFTWLSTSASYLIWYRFPAAFILDGLYASLIEWGVAGLAIAAIVRPHAAPTTPGQTAS